MPEFLERHRGVVKRVLSIGAGGGAIISLAKGLRTTVRVVIPYDLIGLQPFVGEVLSVWGYFENHAVYGEQLVATAVRAEEPTLPELPGLVGRHPGFPVLSTRRARKLARSMGDALIPALNTKDIEALLRVGLELSAAVALVRQWERYWAEKRTAELLMEAGLRPTRTHEILRLLGANAANRIRCYPYTLIPFFPWRKVDGFATACCGVSPKSHLRLIAAAESVILDMEKMGRLAASYEHVLIQLERKVEPSLTVQAVEYAIGAKRLVSFTAPTGRMLRGMGVSIILNQFKQRLSDFATQARPAKSHFRSYQAKQSVPRPVRLLSIPCTTAVHFASSVNVEDRPLHIVATRWQRDAVIASNRGAAITINEILNRTPRRPRHSYRSVYVHNCNGLDFLTLSKIFQRLELGCSLHLCFNGPLQRPPLLLPNIWNGETVAAPSPIQLVEAPKTITPESGDMGEAAHALSNGALPTLERVRTGESSLKGAAFMACESVQALVAETKAAFYAGRSKGRTVVLTSKSTACRNFNISVHNDWVEFLIASNSDVPLAYLRNHESATEGEPVVCWSRISRLNLMRGSLGTIIEIYKRPQPAVLDGVLVVLAATVSFDCVGEVALSKEDLKNLSLAYALPLERAQFGEWDHLVVPLDRPKLLRRIWAFRAIAIATSSIIFIAPEPISFTDYLRPEKNPGSSFAMPF